jgi:electron transport complex protein RnfC
VFIKSKGTHISEHKGHKELSAHSPVLQYLNPEYVYIPLVEQNTPCEALVKVGDRVKIGQVVAMKTGRFSSPIHASISGEVISINQKMWHSSGKMVPTIQIKNDFQEEKVETIKANDVANLSKEDIIELVRVNGVVGLGGSGFPAYAKYKVDKPMDYVIINAAECEPYLTCDYVLLTEHLDRVLRGLRYIMKAVAAPKGVIAVKENKKALIEKIRMAIADQPDLSLILLKDVYPAGWEKYIVQRVTNKTYRSLPSEAGAIVNNSSTAYAICQAVEDNQPLVEKYVTITGEGIKDPRNVHLKIGTNLKDVINQLGYTPDLGDAYFIAGGPMTGKALMFDSLVVNRALTSVVVMPKDIREVNPECMGCGKCGDVCPVFLSPIVIKEALGDNDLDTLVSLKPELCMQCGLCSYICPSRIELTDAVTRAKTKVLAKR